MARDEAGQGQKGRAAAIAGTAAVAIIVAIAVISAGYTSIDVEPGEVGYVYSKPLLLPGGGFVQTLPGPARWGVCWRKFSTNIDVRQFTMDEAFSVLAKDDLTISFHAHAMLSVKSDPDSVRAVVEKYYGEKWYEEFFKERFRAKIYDAVREHDSRSAKEKRAEIGKEVLAAMREICADTPFTVHDVVIGYITYPKVVQEAVEQKLAAQQELERAAVRVDIAKREAQVKIEEAKGVAEAQHIINNTLTTNYIRHEYVNALMQCARSPNTTIIYVPLGSDGLPFVLDAAAPALRRTAGPAQAPPAAPPEDQGRR
ncbi:MAG: SPFH domain-containing protein [Planctomycetota bacterium]|nr:SPFH domain-containing protein [Planctomycetota bacterium]